MKRKFAGLLAAVLVSTSLCAAPALAEEGQVPVSITLDGVLLELEAAPLYDTVNGRVSIPIRPFSESVGAEVQWNTETNTATVVKNKRYMSYSLNQMFMYQGRTDAAGTETKVLLDVPPVLVNDRTFVPVRALMEGLGYAVDWDDVSQTVVLTTVPDTAPTATAAPVSTPAPTETPAPSAEPEEISDAFMASFYENLPKDQNLLVSPVSLKLLLALASNDSNSSLKQKVLPLLGEEDLSDYNVYAKNYLNTLQTLPVEETARASTRFGIENLHIYRSEMFSGEPTVQDNFPSRLNTAYLAKNNYETTVRSASSMSQPPYVKLLNDWVRNATRYPKDYMLGMSDDAFFKSLFLSSVTAEGLWKTSFGGDGEKTFTQADGTSAHVPFMTARGQFPFYQNSRFAAVGLPLQAAMTLYVVLPEEGVNPLEFFNHQTEMTEKNLSVSIPRAELNQAYKLRPVLEGMGFQGLLTDNKEYGDAYYYNPVGTINDVVQFTALSLNETGITPDTEPGGTHEETASADNAFTADRPFTCFLCDSENNEVLLMLQYVKGK